mmetsp:Transcript_82770/g.146176  ORF Transcript_82770/g.146176 Transcript_82770/m.146176 type:complete len:214 (-) Transcript_82770:3332-3973(-)
MLQATLADASQVCSLRLSVARCKPSLHAPDTAVVQCSRALPKRSAAPSRGMAPEARWKTDHQRSLDRTPGGRLRPPQEGLDKDNAAIELTGHPCLPIPRASLQRLSRLRHKHLAVLTVAAPRRTRHGNSLLQVSRVQPFQQTSSAKMPARHPRFLLRVSAPLPRAPAAHRAASRLRRKRRPQRNQGVVFQPDLRSRASPLLRAPRRLLLPLAP